MTITLGTYISSDVTRSWGVSPGSGVVVIPGDVSGSYSPGDEVTLNLGGDTFQGIVSSVNTSADGVGGTFTRIEIFDNRIHLQWDSIKLAYNFTEVRADNPATPGIDRQRRYWSIQSDDHVAQLKTWSDTPFTARHIVDDINASLDVAFGWTISDPDGLLDQPVYEIDANNGAKVGNVLSEICSQLGIVFTVTGYDTLLFSRKGTGDIPYIDPATEASQSSGSSLSHADTHIEVVGGRNVYQDTVTLEPWWNDYWNDYVNEPDWLARVEEVWGSEWSSLATNAEKSLARAIKAREVTLRDYNKALGGLAPSDDYGMWGEVCRMEIPVWRYLHDIVFRAYRVPRDYSLSFSTELGDDSTRTLTVQSLTFHEHLLGAMDYDPSSGDCYLKVTPDASYPQWYPPDAAFIITKGFRVGSVDPRVQKVITPAQLAAARDTWVSTNDFTLDPRPESLGVIFGQMLVMDTTENPFYKFPNQVAHDGDPAVDTTHPLYNVAVPNLGAVMEAAEVKMTIAWEADKYIKAFGSGPRYGTLHSEGIAGHYIMYNGVVTREVPWPDDTYADDKAEAFAASMIGQQVYFDVGSIKRAGGCGTALTGMVDKVHVTINMEGGTQETIDLTKERPPVGYYSQRLLDRLARQHDLFQHQRAHRIEVWELQSQLAMRKQLDREMDEWVARAIQTLFGIPVGNAHCSPAIAKLPASTAAGTPIWTDVGTGDVSTSGTVLTGVSVAEDSNGECPVATQGTVPTRVKGPFSSGDTVGVNGTNTYCEVGGDRPVGQVLVDYPDPEVNTDTVVAPVRLGSSQPAVSYLPFECRLNTARVGGGSPVAAVWEVKKGTLNNVVPTPSGATASSWGWTFSVSSTLYVMLQESIAANGAVSGQTLIISNSEILDDFGPGDWPKVIHRTMAELEYDDSTDEVTLHQYFKGSQFAYLGLLEVTCDGQTRGVIWQ